MRTSVPGLRRILLATDLEPKSDRAMERAVRLARQFGADLTALHVAAGNGPYDHLAPHHVEAELHRLLVSMPDAHGVTLHVAAVRGEDVARLVAEHTAQWKSDLVVVGVHQQDGLADLFLPSTIERIMDATGLPLLVVRDRPAGPYASALVAVDFSARSRASVDAARVLVGNGCLTLLHVVDVPGTARRSLERSSAAEFTGAFDELLADADGERVPAVATAVRVGVPAEEIAGAVREEAFPLVVMGAHGRSGLSRTLLGSTTRDVLERPPCDVLVVASPRAD